MSGKSALTTEQRLIDLERNQALMEQAINLLFQMAVPTAVAANTLMEENKAAAISLGQSPSLQQSSLMSRIRVALEELQKEARKNA